VVRPKHCLYALGLPSHYQQHPDTLSGELHLHHRRKETMLVEEVSQALDEESKNCLKNRAWKGTFPEHMAQYLIFPGKVSFFKNVR
jgi:hypothetical protein